MLRRCHLRRGGGLERVRSFCTAALSPGALPAALPLPALLLPALFTPEEALWTRHSRCYRREWSAAQLERRYGEELFHVGSDVQTQEPLLMSLTDFLAQSRRGQRVGGGGGAATTAAAADPLYLFDATFEVGCPQLLQKYTAPRQFAGGRGTAPGGFAEDVLFALLPPEQCPDHRWLLLGAAGSGSALHVDPIGSAWNGVMEGAKRWVVVAPELVAAGEAAVPAAAAAACGAGAGGGTVEAWFEDDGCGWPHWRRWLQARSGGAVGRWFEFTQRAGEVVYVPQGWAHAVLNLETFTVAITHNFVAEHDVDRCWQFLRADHPMIAARWHAALVRARPEIASRLHAASDAATTATATDN
jgi:hypothetical protein